MAAMESGYDKSAGLLKNYAAMSMYAAWPGFDASYAPYSAASAAHHASATRALGGPVAAKAEVADSGSPQIGSSPPSGFGFTQTSPPGNLTQAFALPANGPVSQFPAQTTTPHLMTPKKKALPVPGHLKDDGYWERRRRNNESARRSREARRNKEDQTHYRLMLLESENLQLKTELSMVRPELERLRLLFSQQQHLHHNSLQQQQQQQQ